MTRRLVLSYLAVTLVVLAILEVPLALNFSQRQLERATSLVERDAEVLASAAEQPLSATTGSHDPVLEGLASQARRYDIRTGGRVVVVDTRGLPLIDTNPTAPSEGSFSNRPEISSALGGRAASGSRHSTTLGGGIVFVALPVVANGSVVGAVRITYGTDTIDSRIRRYWLVLALLAAVTLCAAAIVGVIVARWVNRPLASLEELAVALGAGRLTARARDQTGPPELQALAKAFNRTADRLQELIGSQESFVADASHQLRTPLTALRLRLENLERDVRPEGVDDLDAALRECARLSRIVDGLLALARAEPAGGLNGQRRVELGPVLKERGDTWASLADERHISFDIDAAPGLTLEATPDHVAQILDNLIANALDAAPDGSTITLSGRFEGRDVAVHVIDRGPGMSAEERAHAFDRFWRAADARRDGLGGSGLGLSIVAKLARADGGSVALYDGPEGGLDATVRLPAANQFRRPGSG